MDRVAQEFCGNSFAHHFRHDENEEGPAQPAFKEDKL
jgi:hypothetical protein